MIFASILLKPQPTVSNKTHFATLLPRHYASVQVDHEYKSPISSKISNVDKCNKLNDVHKCAYNNWEKACDNI